LNDILEHIITRIRTPTAHGWSSVQRYQTVFLYRVRGVDGSRAEHLTVESYTVAMLLTFILIIIY